MLNKELILKLQALPEDAVVYYAGSPVWPVRDIKVDPDYEDDAPWPRRIIIG
jgi:hypothetical protein